ncbi:MAG TPA: response regulator [Candidatus Acidoferrum sp.]|nr:response regulator [Candidatus Acidoferrum sp.]
MSTPRELIQQIYHVRQGEQLNRVVEQIDAMSRMILKLFAGDFVAVFYSRGEQTGMIPVAFQGWNDSPIDGMADLEKMFDASGAATDQLKRGYVNLDAKAGSISDAFAQKNRFTYRFQCPIHASGDIRGAIVVYWRNRPQSDNANATHLVNALVEILASWMALVEEMQAADSFSLRLTSLLSLFEIPLDEHPTTELAVQIVRTARSAIRDSAIGLISRDPITGEFRMIDFSAPMPVSRDLEEALLKSCSELLTNLRQKTISSCAWHDLSGRLSVYDLAAYAIELHRDERYQFGVIFFQDKRTPFAPADLELINIFRMFAETILGNALLVKSLRKTNEKIRESSGRLADAETMAALADMSSGIAHDFNNTIGGVVGRLQLLKMKCHDEVILTSLTKIENQALEAANTVKRLQQFSSGVKAKTLKAMDIVPVLRSYFDSQSRVWSELARQKYIQVQPYFELSEAVVNASADDFETSLDKLIQNAVEFAPERSEVRVTLSGTSTHLLLGVSDTGPGIPDGIRAKVFYPFFTTKGVRGAGLGLAIVYGIVTRLGGKVTVESQPGSGTLFQISLGRLANEDEVTEITRKTRKTRELRVLVVDDDDQIRDILGDMLNLDGHIAVSCSDGYTALKSLESEPFDIMITDLGMPGMSGLDLAAAAHQKHPQMPIAMITGWGAQLDHDEVAVKGIRAILPKPFHLKDVKALVLELTAEPASDHAPA